MNFKTKAMIDLRILAMIREYPNDADLGAAVRALEIKNCTTCKNVLISTHSEPCRKCLLYNKWEPKTQLP